MRNTVANLGNARALACWLRRLAATNFSRQDRVIFETLLRNAVPSLKFAIRIVALCLCLAATKAFAVEVETNSTASKNVALVESESPFSFEFHAEETYVGQGDVQRGSLSV